MTSISLVGYFAVLERLRVDRLPLAGGGSVGERLTPTLTCDAVLVAMHLWEWGMPATLVASHPGTNTLDARVAVDFVRARTADLILGPDCGQPFELEITAQNDARTWVNDPRPGLRSLVGIAPRASASGEILYVDAYPWLEASSRKLAGELDHAARLTYVNLGQLEELDLPRLAAPWIESARGAMILQASIPGVRGDAARQRLLSVGSSLGATLVVMTAGAGGVGVSSTPRDSVWVDAHPLDAVRDSSGAGAAVSAACLLAAAAHDLDDLEALATALARAGAMACEIDGGLPGASAAEWERHVPPL